MPTVAWIEPVIDRTLEDCVYGNPRGAIIAEVLNRIDNNVLYIKQVLDEYNANYDRDIVVDCNWEHKRYFRLADLQRIEKNVLHLRQSMLIEVDTPDFEVTEELEQQWYEHWNDIERIGVDILKVWERVLLDFLYCGEFWCGNNKDGQYYPEWGMGGKATPATPVTFTVEQLGGEYNFTSTTGVKIVFSRPVTYCKASAFVFEQGGATYNVSNFRGEGDTYYFDITNVKKQGTASVKINPFGDFYSTSGELEFEVYMSRAFSINYVDGAATEGVTSRYTFRVGMNEYPDGTYILNIPNLPAGFTVSPIILKDYRGTITFDYDGTTPSGRYHLKAYIEEIESNEFTLDVIANDWLFAGTFNVQLKRPEPFECQGEKVPYTTDVTFTVEQVGGTKDYVQTTAVKITFNKDVDYLTVDKIHIADDTGICTTGALTGSGKVYQLAVTDVQQQGDVLVSVDNFSSFRVVSDPQPCPVYFYGRHVTVEFVNGTADKEHGGKFSYTVSSAGVPDGTYALTVNGAPTGISAPANITFKDGASQFSLTAAPGISSQKYYITIVVDELIANIFSFTIMTYDTFICGWFNANSSYEYTKEIAGLYPLTMTEDRTFTITQVGGTAYKANTTGIKITFNAPVNYLKLSDITILNVTGVIDIGELTGSGKEYIVTVDDVTTQGSISVKIKNFSDFRVMTGTLTTDVYMGSTLQVAKQSTPVNHGHGGVATYEIVGKGFANVTYNLNVHGLPAGATAPATLTFSNEKATLKITCANTIEAKTWPITIDIDEVYSNQFLLICCVDDWLYSGSFYAMEKREDQFYTQGNGTPINPVEVTYTVEESGGVWDTTPSEGVIITFNKPVTYFRKSDIVVTDGTGAAILGELTGEGTTYMLHFTQVIRQGTISVVIKDFAEFDTPNNEVTIIINRAREFWISEQVGAIAQGTPGSVKFNATTVELRDGTYPLQIIGTYPSGMTFDQQLTIIDGHGTFVAETDGTATQGKFTLSAIVDTVPSNNTFILAITN